MNHCKRILAALAAACLTLALLAGCSPSAPENTGAASAPGGGDENTLRVVATIFPIYDWAREVLGQVPGVELVWLQDTGVDMHSYQPTAEDMLLVSSCDLFLYVGRHLGQLGGRRFAGGRQQGHGGGQPAGRAGGRRPSGGADRGDAGRS